MNDFLASWYDSTINADVWFKRFSVTPEEAAMLLCGIDPLERDSRGNAPDPERTYVDGDQTSPERYRRLRRVFLDVSQHDSKPLTLLEWRDVAKHEGIKYHQWINEHDQAQDQRPANRGVSGSELANAGKSEAEETHSTIPGKMPRIAIGKLAVTAAWKIERETGHRATAMMVIKQLQDWAVGKKYSDTLMRAAPEKRAVIWVTRNTSKEKEYDELACGKTLETWRNSLGPTRDQGR